MSTLIFHAIQDADIVKLFYETTGKKLNVIISYAYLKGNTVKLVNDYRQMMNYLYLDSGAFTANRGKSKITVRFYAHFLKRFGSKFDVCFTFDDRFDDPEHNQHNYEFIQNQIDTQQVTLVPVIHDQVQPIEELKRYYQGGAKFIAIGSSGKKLEQEEIAEIRNMEGLRIHMFGDLNRDMLKNVLPYSADSAASQHMSRFGCIYYWDTVEEREYCINLGGREKKKRESELSGKNVHIDDFLHKDRLREFLSKTLNYELESLFADHTKQKIVNHYFLWQLENEILPSELQSVSSTATL